MSFSEPTAGMKVKILSRRRITAARLVAMAADALQIGFFPLFGEGFVSPLNDALDIGVCLVLTFLVGWHFAFLPSFLVELVPVADLVPTWTIAVLLATRHKQTGPFQSQGSTWSSVTVREDGPAETTGKE